MIYMALCSVCDSCNNVNVCSDNCVVAAQYKWLCSECIYTCNDCNTCQSENMGEKVCDTEQKYNKIISICTTNNEYISYENSWEPIINAINEIYDYEHGTSMLGTKTIDSKITNTGDTNIAITLNLYNEAQSRLKTTAHNKNDVMLGTYFADLTNALKNNKFSSNLCQSCNACNNCNATCEDCNNCVNTYRYVCSECVACQTCQGCNKCDNCLDGVAGADCTNAINCIA